MAYILLVKYKFKLLTPHFFIVSYKISKNSACLQTVDKLFKNVAKNCGYIVSQHIATNTIKMNSQLNSALTSLFVFVVILA